MSVRWGWRAVLSSSQSEISFARVKVAIVFLPFLGLSFEGLPALVGFGFTSRIDTRSLSGHGDSFRAMTDLGCNATTGRIVDRGSGPCQEVMRTKIQVLASRDPLR